MFSTLSVMYLGLVGVFYTNLVQVFRIDFLLSLYRPRRVCVQTDYLLIFVQTQFTPKFVILKTAVFSRILYFVAYNIND